MAEIMKYGQDREGRPNPLVEKHPGFTAANGDEVGPYVRIVKFRRTEGKWTSQAISVALTRLPNLIADLTAALEDSE